MKYDVIVIGGGAAGLMAASVAAQYQKKVLLLDKNERLGRKLLITGKGRCNVTNDCDLNDFLKNIPTNPKFLYSALSQFTTQDSKAFFEEQNVPLKTERGNRVFPVSDKAADVCNALANSCKHNNVIVKAERVIAITQSEAQITGVKCESGEHYSASSVIIATGGLSYPLTGSNGDGYALAKALGHTITAIRPSLVPLESNDEVCKDLQGLSLKNVEVSLFDKQKNKVIFKELGEMLFTHFGLTGPLILSASSHIQEMEPNRYIISIDLKPGLSESQLDARVLRDFQKNANKDFVNGLGELLPRKMIPIIVANSKIPPFTKINQITKEMRKDLVQAIKCLEIEISNFRPIDEAIITSGGIKTTEINPKTMESKLINGLFFAGEVIDVDGYTGGFNLQIAFSTGYLAGLNC
ncbi:NAD(P)/FAD-dependent oxidoreductase [Paludicola sp. MB14-C6]|uniref:NAD(P)/FAD-dependent oxidoreductase n=1 Tax=Paludihabitans sp. MB14-C6 TaxID=3070656 RepID=UPI0027DC62BD|nr:NAD(P)/FAD-dependent oxidoreductase [Paludicola sp. MB14-C6]WMJ23529.1 NAD(P)/FAD-dependent oxidoreductase [Paludicola sp. MB14-C6]